MKMFKTQKLLKVPIFEFLKLCAVLTTAFYQFSDLITVTISDIAVGYEHILALSSDGDIYSWGRGKNGRLGHGDQETQTKPVKILTDINFKLIFAGFNHSFASKLNPVFSERTKFVQFQVQMFCMVLGRINITNLD